MKKKRVTKEKPPVKKKQKKVVTHKKSEYITLSLFHWVVLIGVFSALLLIACLYLFG